MFYMENTHRAIRLRTASTSDQIKSERSDWPLSHPSRNLRVRLHFGFDGEQLGVVDQVELELHHVDVAQYVRCADVRPHDLNKNRHRSFKMFCDLEIL